MRSVEGSKGTRDSFYGNGRDKKTSWFRDVFIFKIRCIYSTSKKKCSVLNFYRYVQGVPFVNNKRHTKRKEYSDSCQKWYIKGWADGPRDEAPRHKTVFSAPQAFLFIHKFFGVFSDVMWLHTSITSNLRLFNSSSAALIASSTSSAVSRRCMASSRIDFYMEYTADIFHTVKSDQRTGQNILQIG